MLKVQMFQCCDLCKRVLQKSQICFDRPETTNWRGVLRELVAAAKKQRWHVSKKYLCTPCVCDIDNDFVCILP